MAAALFGFCLLAIASRELTRHMATLDILFWRSLLGFGVVSLVLMRAGVLNPAGLRPQLIGWHLLRNSTHFCGQCAWLIAIAALPLAEVFALEFTTPLWAALLAALFMGEPMNRGRWLALLLGLLGILVILRPGAAAINPASLVMLAGAASFAVSVIVTRKLTQLLHGHPQTFFLVLFYMTLMQGLFAFLPIATELQVPPAEVWHWLLVAALTALAAHYCLSRALSYADAAVVMPIDYLRLPLIMVAAWWLYGEAVSLWLLLGAALIIAGNALGLYLETRKLRRALQSAQA
ncbi:DMT family transporter [Pseudohalioglobus sediminis]|uniref:DMT family transporter n=1 Tax=Pseudohalioglobus sediminis TaxID=2606449 RepID=A0A5B0WZI6_9GAMM|nr:DMT family transporter [Pseudohalioglobus sediminis]KAA1191807.1 DMT family transporter [Pseudohalioglobus sediminis]